MSGQETIRTESLIGNCFRMRLPEYVDDRGRLTLLKQSNLDFEINRVFYIQDVPKGKYRGGHAHLNSQQCLLAVNGTFEVVLELEDQRIRTELEGPNEGIYAPPMTWVRLEEFSEDAICLVVASNTYNGAGSIEDYEEYKSQVSDV